MARALMVCLATTLGCTEGSRPARLIILGFDGADPRRVESLIERGVLPNIAALRGYRGPLATTEPPLSAVAWSSFATGGSPAHHGIFDVVTRRARDYEPIVTNVAIEPARMEAQRRVPMRVRSLRRGEAFWDVIARAGVGVRVQYIPYSYPNSPDGARLLGGGWAARCSGDQRVLHASDDDVRP